MDQSERSPFEQMLLALLQPVARLIISSDIGLAGAVELLKSALVEEGFAQVPQASVSHLSLMTGVHRKDIKRLETGAPNPSKATAAARVLTLWQNEPGYLEDGHPRVLRRSGDFGFDALVNLAKVDAASATVLSSLIASGNIVEEDGLIRFVTASLVPHDRDEKMQAAVATLVPHLDTTIGNLIGQDEHLDQALRYSHLSKDAANELEADATRMALEMLQILNKRAIALQNDAEGSTLFVAGAYINRKVQGE